MRSVMLRLFVGILVSVIAGTPSAMALQAPRFGGTLVIAASSDPGMLDGGITTASPAHTAADSIYNGLVQLDPHNAAPVGTGPFKFSEWHRGSQVTLVKNEQTPTACACRGGA